ncbi:hypothetical protein LQL77_30760, partial [Rhodococcus cerastii]|nr:hypothetical protein [Rhodococcus cerastii]
AVYTPDGRKVFHDRYKQDLSNLPCPPTSGCRIEIYNPFLIPNTDIRVHMTFHPAPTPDTLLCPTLPSEPLPNLAPAQAAPGLDGPYFSEDMICKKMDEHNPPVVLISSPPSDGRGELPEYYFLRRDADGLIELPHRDGRELRLFNLHELQPTDHHRQIRLVNETLGWPRLIPLTSGNYLLTFANHLWISNNHRDSRPHQASTELPPAAAVEAAQFPELVESPGPGTEPSPRAEESNACDPEREVCVLSIAGPPDRGGAIPLKAVALDPLKYPDVDVAAPATPTKNLIVLAPPAAAGITSVTVTTRRGSSAAGTQYTLEPDHMLVVNDKETLTSTRPNTH